MGDGAIKCLSCGEHLSNPAYRFCPWCGSPAPIEVECPHCGKAHYVRFGSSSPFCMKQHQVRYFEKARRFFARTGDADATASAFPHIKRATIEGWARRACTAGCSSDARSRR